MNERSVDTTCDRPSGRRRIALFYASMIRYSQKAESSRQNILQYKNKFYFKQKSFYITIIIISETFNSIVRHACKGVRYTLLHRETGSS